MLPEDVRNIIMDYYYGLEHYTRFRRVVIELYYHGYLRRRPRYLTSLVWFCDFV